MAGGVEAEKKGEQMLLVCVTLIREYVHTVIEVEVLSNCNPALTLYVGVRVQFRKTDMGALH